MARKYDEAISIDCFLAEISPEVVVIPFARHGEM